MMYFTQINDDIVIDQIPLAEITRVKEMEAADKVIDDSKDDNELMIETNSEGYNSGRTYYLQADSKLSCQDKIKKLSQYRKAAYERAHAQSLFRQAQRRVLKFYRSTWFQRVMAFLIISVNSRNCASDPRDIANPPFDRTLASPSWTRSTSRPTPSASTTSSSP
jgi:hypothetical protein